MRVHSGSAFALMLFACSLWAPTLSFAKEITTCGNFDVSDWRGWSDDLEQQEDAYNEIGDWRQQMAADTWSDVAYGTMPYDLTVNGTVYTSEEINQMSEGEREELANAFLQQYSLDGETALEALNRYRAEREAFLRDPENEEFAQFDAWSVDVQNYEGGVSAYWEEMAHRGSPSYNPIAASFYRDVSEFVRPRQLDEVLTSTDAYIVVMSFPCGAFEV